MEDANLIPLDLGATSLETIRLFLDESSDEGLFEEVLNVNKSRPDVLRLLMEHPDTPNAVRAEASRQLMLPVPLETDLQVIRKHRQEELEKQPQEERTQRLVITIQRMTVSEKIKLAQKGNSQVRTILMRDSNKLVILSVLGNPRITDSEIEGLAKNRSVVEDALRVIAKKKEWMKNYKVQLALVQNPKTPPGISMTLLSELKKNDLKMLEKNKNVSEGVRALAKKLVRTKMG